MRILMALIVCLGLFGCASSPKKTLPPPQPATKPSSNLSASLPEAAQGPGAEAAAEMAAEPYFTQEEMNEVIDLFTQAIAQNPDYANFYYNRAVAYFYIQDYSNSWQDLHKAEELGLTPDRYCIIFVNKLKKASGREK